MRRARVSWFVVCKRKSLLSSCVEKRKRKEGGETVSFLYLMMWPCWAYFVVEWGLQTSGTRKERGGGEGRLMSSCSFAVWQQ